MSKLIHPLGVSKRPGEQLFLAISVGALGTLGFSVTAPLLPDLAEALDVSRGSIGLVQAAVSVSSLFLSMMIGYLADRLGRRRVVLVSLLIFATFGAAGFWARTFWGLVAVRLIQGVGTSGILGLGLVIVADLYEGTARQRAMGFNMAGITFVNMMGPIVSGFIGQGGVFRPFLIFLIGYPLALWATRLPVEPVRDVESPLSHASEAIVSLRTRGRLGDFVGLLFATVGVAMLLHGIGFTTAPLFLDSEFGMEASGRGLVISTFQFGVVVAAVQIGRLRARHSGARLVGAAFTLMSLGMLSVALAPEWWFVSLGLGIAGAGFGLYTPQAQERAASMGGAAYRGLTVLTWVTSVRFAQVIGPPLGSWVGESLGPRPTFLIAGAVMLAAAMLWLPVRRLAARRLAPGRERIRDT